MFCCFGLYPRWPVCAPWWWYEHRFTSIFNFQFIWLIISVVLSCSWYSLLLMIFVPCDQDFDFRIVILFFLFCIAFIGVHRLSWNIRCPSHKILFYKKGYWSLIELAVLANGFITCIWNGFDISLDSSWWSLLYLCCFLYFILSIILIGGFLVLVSC